MPTDGFLELTDSDASFSKNTSPRAYRELLKENRQNASERVNPSGFPVSQTTLFATEEHWLSWDAWYEEQIEGVFEQSHIPATHTPHKERPSNVTPFQYSFFGALQGIAAGSQVEFVRAAERRGIPAEAALAFLGRAKRDTS